MKILIFCCIFLIIISEIIVPGKIETLEELYEKEHGDKKQHYTKDISNYTVISEDKSMDGKYDLMYPEDYEPSYNETDALTFWDYPLKRKIDIIMGIIVITFLCGLIVYLIYIFGKDYIKKFIAPPYSHSEPSTDTVSYHVNKAYEDSEETISFKNSEERDLQPSAIVIGEEESDDGNGKQFTMKATIDPIPRSSSAGPSSHHRLLSLRERARSESPQQMLDLGKIEVLGEHECKGKQQ